MAATEVASARVEAGDGPGAQVYAERATQLNPDLPYAHVVLARSLGAQARFDEAYRTLDEAQRAAARTEQSAASAEEKQAAKATAATINNWRADLLCRDGQRLMTTDSAAARERFRRAQEAAPGTIFAKNASTLLQNMDVATPATMPALPGDPNAGMLPNASSPAAPPAMPEGWDRNYGLLPGQ